MSVTKNIVIAPGRFAHLVSITFEMNVPGRGLFHQNLMDENNNNEEVVIQHTLCTIDDLLNLHDTTQNYLFSFIDRIDDMGIDDNAKSQLKHFFAQWRDQAIGRK